jgi:hypothetical protein
MLSKEFGCGLLLASDQPARSGVQDSTEQAEGSRSVFAVRRLASDEHAAWKEVLNRVSRLRGQGPGLHVPHRSPTRSWLKAKVRREWRFVVGGVVERSEGWSLLLGSHKDNG